jgi:rare lipoprotein A
VKKGLKRSFVLMMFTAIPLLSASPTSAVQEVTPSISPVTQDSTVAQRIEVKQDVQLSFGTASWYSQSDPFINLRTANGEIFDDTKMTCASWYYPFKTRLKITNLNNGRSIICVVNDRGPAKRLGRVVDLTRSAFRKIANPNSGLVRVSVIPVDD